MELKRTIFCDIDGCIIKHNGSLMGKQRGTAKILRGSITKLREWEEKGYMIILTTGRKESLRKETEETLRSLGIQYDQLIMGLPRGARVIINDRKPDIEEDMAYAWSPERNIGISNCPY